MTPDQKYREWVPAICLRGLDQPLAKVTIEFGREGAPVEAKVIVKNEFATDPMYVDLRNTVLRITNVMSQTNFSTGLQEGESTDMDEAVNEYRSMVANIAKKKNQQTARKMLDATIDEIGGSSFFKNLPDSEARREQWQRTLHTHFDQTFEIPQAHTRMPKSRHSYI